MGKRFLLVLLAFLVITGFAWSGGNEEESGEATMAPAEATVSGDLKESPMLAARVAAGDLPPLAERIPEEPFIVGPGVLMPEEDLDWEVGRFGGTMRVVRNSPNWDASVFIQNDTAFLDIQGLNADVLAPAVVKDFLVSDDQTEFTFILRKGMKWSDGMPVTTEDVRFTWEDFLLNEQLTPVLPAWMKAGSSGTGKPMELDIIDEFSFKLTFESPYGGFPVQMAIAGWRGYTELLKPAHFLKDYHPKYTPLDKLEPLIAAEELSAGEWWTLFNLKDVPIWHTSQPKAIGFPLLTPWIMVDASSDTYIYERNPYYFKVDIAGNQLPYIDKMESYLVENEESAILKCLAGEVDHSYVYATMESLPLFKENEEKGNYNTILYDLHRTSADIWLNMSYDDAVWQEVLQDVRFRQALNYAINRDEILDAVYFGFAEKPSQFPVEFNPTKANQLLDEMGMDKKDSDGFRLGPDGKRFTVPIEYTEIFGDYTPVAELVTDYWGKVGIHTTLKVIESGLRATRKSANELQGSMLWSSVTLWWNFVPFLAGDENFGPAWTEWWTSGGVAGVEPALPEMKEFFSLLDKAWVVSPTERVKVVEDFTQIMYDNVFWFGIVDKAKYAVLINKDIGNVAHQGFGIGAQFAGEQYFFRTRN